MLERDLLFAPDGLSWQSAGEMFQSPEGRGVIAGGVLLAKCKDCCDLKGDEAVALRPQAVRILSLECCFHRSVDADAGDAFA
jgi:hypothetical protein